MKELLAALAQGQIKLAEGQVKLEATVSQLAQGQLRIAEGQVKLESTVAHLASATEGALTRLTERLDSFRDAILNGFTNGADRDRKLEDELRALEARIKRLEQKRHEAPRESASERPFDRADGTFKTVIERQCN